jgi:hypothetical protein
MLNNEHAKSNWCWHCWVGFFHFRGLQPRSVLKRCWMYRLYRGLLAGNYSIDHWPFAVDHHGQLLSLSVFLFFLTQRCWLLDVVRRLRGRGGGGGWRHFYIQQMLYFEWLQSQHYEYSDCPHPQAALPPSVWQNKHIVNSKGKTSMVEGPPHVKNNVKLGY